MAVSTKQPIKLQVKLVMDKWLHPTVLSLPYFKYHNIVSVKNTKNTQGAFGISSGMAYFQGRGTRQASKPRPIFNLISQMQVKGYCLQTTFDSLRNAGQRSTTFNLI